MAMTPLEVAKHYADLFNQGKHTEMGLLYAEDALWSRPDPIPDVRGREAISSGYSSPEHAAQTEGMQITNQRYYVDGNAVAADFTFVLGGQVVSHVIDLFEVDEDGLISSMVVFRR